MLEKDIKNKIPIYPRADVLADVVSLKKNIIITGSHGKTTTTSPNNMIPLSLHVRLICSSKTFVMTP